ncbi:hypothetical protein DSM112329_04750 [Paraconexibacter sp. AEG42_29]|uniref:BREX-2 system phosphatase PglZ n=1 Tax=Paraconexibacter sp. AEG42_29 TaxID=2997339 RepID=A0AAU7B1Q5_9ACTN
MSGTVTPERLWPQLEAWLAGDPSRPIFAVYHEGDWSGSDVLMVGDRYVDVRVCRSELAVREVLSAPREAGRGLVLLTSIDQLGADVLARLARPRVHRLHSSDALLPLFGVRAIDPALARQRWLIDALVDSAPRAGYESAGALQLDLARAWRALLVHRYGIDPDGGLGGLLAWAASPGTAFVEAEAAERKALTARLVGTMPGAEAVLAVLDAGDGDDVVALGLVMRVLLNAPDGAARVAARTRLEVRLKGWAFDAGSAAAWSLAAEATLDALPSHLQATVQHRADRLIEILQAESLVAASDHLTSGLRARMAAFGGTLAAWTAGKRSIAAVAADADRIAQHRLADSLPDAPHRLALALARWLDLDAASPPDLRAAALLHATDGSYADWARSTLRNGAGEPTFDAAVRKLVAKADARRESEEEHFAQTLASWSAHSTTDDALLGVEHILERVVGPLAVARPLLFIVMDGMGHRVANELLDDLSHAGWTELRRTAHSERALAVSVLPSVTAVSRTSLLTGSLRRGTMSDEQAAFPTHTALVSASAGGEPPRLFHKGAITDRHGGLTAELSAEVAGDRRVVGAVINAIDDHLARSEQLRTSWGARDILPLWWLLEAAREAGRIVVLASDHGHVLEHGSTLNRGSGDGGERWQRATGRSLETGEVVVQGTRVLVPEGACVLAWSEKVRYAVKKNGYHGGASAQEVLTPLLVLAPGLVDTPDGWSEAPYDPPAWWLGDPASDVVAPGTGVPDAPPAEPRPGEQMTLAPDGPPADVSATGWITELLASDVFAERRASAGRTPVPDERTIRILAALDAHGGQLLKDALARACGIPVMRLTGMLAALRQMLNIDGYQTLTVDPATGDVKLDRVLLAQQFGLSGP